MILSDENDFKYGKDICTPETGIRYFKPDVDLKYNQGSDWNGRGFVVGWVAFRDPYDGKCAIPIRGKRENMSIIGKTEDFRGITYWNKKEFVVG